MNKVVTINLNGKAYQLEEGAYDALRAYLSQAAASLSDNPDKDEIMKDFEQAIADKCDQVVSPHKNVVTADEIKKIIDDMGPVHSTSSTSGEKTSEQTSDYARRAHRIPRRLFRIKEGAVLAGLCNGLAVYLNVDVTIIRIIFILLAFLTHGAMIAIYLLMAIFIPYARTEAEKATAYGEEFTASQFMQKLREKYAKMERKFDEKFREDKKE